ncbi:(2Fe-2S) ferredoxin domain-containing protein [Coxiella endosymbiont of Amblyomma sculptum]|nr:(2Fe-2S) ferredoxin domain-containing protein [Coxiella endosymbiont of Amblyomma sculptum]
MIVLENEKLRRKLDILQLDNIRYHIFLCCDQKSPRCCQKSTGLESWEYLTKRLSELRLVGTGGIYRTKANCLRICCQGPIAIVYPHGVWYHSCSPNVIELIIQKHFLNEQPVEEYILFKKK